MNSKKLSKYFKDHKYVIVPDIMDRKVCKSLSDHLLTLVSENKTRKDEQCPLSDSIYGDPVFDKLLEDLKPKIEAATGLKLNPTYSYARKYAPGDRLDPHIDRPACEISATLTLDYDGRVWPIHVSRDETVENDIGGIELDVGSMVIYRGLDINHWREPYTEGKWQCQVFLHYVDAEGPYKDLKYDTRPVLGASTTTKQDNTSNINYIIFGLTPEEKYMYMIKEDFLTTGAINVIIDYSRDKTTAARIGLDSTNNELDTKIRNAASCWLPVDRFDWLYQQIEATVKELNWFNFKFMLNGMELANYLEYHASAKDEVDEHGHGKYVKHIDGGINNNRKLTFSIQLSDPSEYEGGDLLLWDAETPITVPKNKGQIVFFPSHVLHEVTPVTRGMRRSLVGWIHGPQMC